MSNERLRSAMVQAGVSLDHVVAKAGVDVKTVQRWLSGRVPHTRNRLAVAALVGEDEEYLWPSARGRNSRVNGAGTSNEVLAAYGHRADAPVSLWRTLLRRARRRIDLIGYAMLHLPEQHPDLLDVIRDACADGCQVRIALADPRGDQMRERDLLEGLGGTLSSRIMTTLNHLAPLRDCDGVAIRLHNVHLYNAIYRFDDDMLVTPYIIGARGYQHPLLHLRRLGPFGTFESFADQFERLWIDTVDVDDELARQSVTPTEFP